MGAIFLRQRGQESMPHGLHETPPGPYLTSTLMANYSQTTHVSFHVSPTSRGRRAHWGEGGCWTDLSPSYSPQPDSFPRWLSTPASLLQRLLTPVADSVCSAWSGAGPVLRPGQSCHGSPGGPLGSAPRPNLAPVACGPCLLALPPAALTRG